MKGPNKGGINAIATATNLFYTGGGCLGRRPGQVRSSQGMNRWTLDKRLRYDQIVQLIANTLENTNGRPGGGQGAEKPRGHMEKVGRAPSTASRSLGVPPRRLASRLVLPSAVAVAVEWRGSANRLTRDEQGKGGANILKHDRAVGSSLLSLSRLLLESCPHSWQPIKMADLHLFSPSPISHGTHRPPAYSAMQHGTAFLIGQRSLFRDEN